MAKDIKNACKYYTYVAKSELNCFNISWTFTDFSKLEIDKEYEIIHHRPYLGSLVLIFKKSSKYVSLSVKKWYSGKVIADITTNLFNENGKELTCTNNIGTCITAERTSLMCYESKLYEDPNSLPNDTLIIELAFCIEQVETWETVEERDYLNYKTEKKLSNDLNKFIIKNHPTVVILKTKDAQIEANKAILCARSSVFEKMFDNPMSEQENDTVLIEDIKGATVEILVNFLNTGGADLKNKEYSSLNELYYAADKYDVQDLRNKCAASILHGLTIENVCTVLEFSKKHSDDHLKKGCMLFFRQNIIPFMESEVWKNLKTSDPDLVSEIFEFYVKGVITNTK